MRGLRRRGRPCGRPPGTDRSVPPGDSRCAERRRRPRWCPRPAPACGGSADGEAEVDQGAAAAPGGDGERPAAVLWLALERREGVQGHEDVLETAELRIGDRGRGVVREVRVLEVAE